MSSSPQTTSPIVDPTAVAWGEHPRIRHIFMKSMLTAADNPFASVSMVRVPVGHEVPRHNHPHEVETVYVLAGRSTLVLGSDAYSFCAGEIVAIPIGLEHALINVGEEDVELLTFFTPPLP